MVFCAVGVGVEIRCHHRTLKPTSLRYSGPVRTRLVCHQKMESLDNSTEEPPSKRLKVDDTTEESNRAPDLSETSPIVPSDSANVPAKESILPPSHSLLGTAPPLQDETGAIIRLMESDVGISEYIAKNVSKINGIIKQRYALNLVTP